MSGARDRLARWIATRDGGITRAQTEGSDESWTTPPTDLAEPDRVKEQGDEPKRPLGDPGDLSDRVRQLNRLTREHGGLR